MKFQFPPKGSPFSFHTSINPLFIHYESFYIAPPFSLYPYPYEQVPLIISEYTP